MTDAKEDAKPEPTYAPKPLTRLERLRREFKTHYGYKPCWMSEKEVLAEIRDAEARTEAGRIKAQQKREEARMAAAPDTNW